MALQDDINRANETLRTKGFAFLTSGQKSLLSGQRTAFGGIKTVAAPTITTSSLAPSGFSKL